MDIDRFLAKDEPPEKPQGVVKSWLFVFASTILFYLFSNLLITAIVFLLHGHMVVEIEWVSMALAAIFAFLFGKRFFKHPRAAAVAVIGAIAGLFAFAILANAPIYDISYDGQTYQQEAVIQLSSGWNPVYQYLDPAVIGGEEKWINWYPKSSWVNESYIYLLTHEERTAKALNIILIVVSIALLYVALTDTGILSAFDAFIVSVLLGCNPVSFDQIFSFYVDGQLCSLLLCICAAGMIIYAGKRPYGFVPLFLAIPIFVNLKFTALVDAFMVLFIIILALWMKKKGFIMLKTLAVGALALALGVALVGFSPYITNTIRYHAPFYPLFGAGAIDLKPYNVPGNFINKNSPEIMFLSFFSPSGDIKEAGTTVSYKIPFTYSNGELVAFRYPDPVEGGFGPLFGGAVIVVFLAMAGYYWIARRRANAGDTKYRRMFWGALWFTLAAFVMCVVNPISSLARYVPQAYLLVIVPIILLLATRKVWSHAAAYAIILLLAYNSYLIGQVYISYNLKTSAEIASELNTMAAESARGPFLVYFADFPSTRMMLNEAGVNYTVTNNPDSCLAGFQQLLPENTTLFCAPTG